MMRKYFRPWIVWVAIPLVLLAANFLLGLGLAMLAGYYVIEDMHTSYWPRGYEGGPPGMDGTSVSLIRGLLDGVNRRYAAKEYPDEAAALTPVDAVHVFEKIAFLKRPEAG